jgi:hypothetical protein
MNSEDRHRILRKNLEVRWKFIDAWVKVNDVLWRLAVIDAILCIVAVAGSFALYSVTHSYMVLWVYAPYAVVTALSIRWWWESHKIGRILNNLDKQYERLSSATD